MGNVSNSNSILPDHFVHVTKNNDSSTDCSICCKPFNIIRRKHDCGACGDVICNDCFSKNENIKCDLQIYGYLSQQSVCNQCLPLLHDNIFSNHLKQIDDQDQKQWNLLNYHHYSIQFTQLTSKHNFAILIPQQIDDYKHLNGIENEFDFYTLWSVKKINIKTDNKYPNTIELLYNIVRNRQYVNEDDDFLFLPQNIYCYKLKENLFILPKIVSINLIKLTNEWKQNYREKNLTKNPIIKYDVFSITNFKMDLHQKDKNVLCYEQKMCPDLNTKLFVEIDNNSSNKKCQNISECSSIKRMKIFLSIFNNNKMNKSLTPNAIIKIYENEIVKYYDIASILNDFIHITNKHNDDLEDIYNEQNICNMQRCKSVIRNQRDETAKRIINNLDNQQNTIIDILDQIHNFILHSFDSGHRLLKKDELLLTNIDNDDEKEPNETYSFSMMRKILHEKRRKFRNLVQNDRISKYKKFVTNVDEKKEEKDEKDKKDDTMVYSFSHRFYYWEYYKNRDIDDSQNPGFKCSALYVRNKYIDLKDELLHNEVCSIDQDDWIEAHKKAEYYMQTAYVKTLKSSDWLCREYDLNIKNGTKIKINYLIVIILYCDYSNFSFHFSSTYRYSSEINTFNKLKQYHSNYHWFARTLRELIEFYAGSKFVTKIANKDDRFYHGVNKLLLFNSSVARFNHPTSTTKRIAVATQFATNEGMILQIGYCKYAVPYFSCSFISKFSNEEEYLFIGGYHWLNINNIINCKTGVAYSKYLKTLNALSIQMKGDHHDDEMSGDLDESILKALIESNKNQIPQYIFDIFSKYKNDTTLITISLTALSKYFGKYLPSLILTSPDNIIKSFINLSFMMNLFVNCEQISIKSRSSFQDNIIIIDDSYLSEMLSHLLSIQNIKSSKLKQIVFSGDGIDIDFSSLQSFKKKYRNQNWNIYSSDFELYIEAVDDGKNDDDDDDMELFKNIENEKENVFCFNVFQCEQIKRLKKLLSFNTSNITDIYQKQMNEYYNITSILNDFAHIISKHGDDLETIINILKLNHCDIKRCISIKRSYRDRMECNDDNKQEDEEQIVLTDIFDQIHNYFLHTFDSGMRLSENEKLKMDEMECFCICGNKMKYIQSKLAYCTIKKNVVCDGCHQLTEKNEMIYHCAPNKYHEDPSRTFQIKWRQIGYDLCEQCANIKTCDMDNINYTFKNIKKVLYDKINEFKKVTKHNGTVKYNKFMSNTNDDKKDNIITNESLHYCSHRFLYWNKHKTNDEYDRFFPEYKMYDAYVPNKYIDLKTELLQNAVCCIDNKIWRYINNRSKKYLKSAYIKCKSPNNPMSRDGYDIEKISLNHLMCVMLYCDYNELSYHLALSLKYSSRIRTLNELKTYHSNYYWFARYLTELVQSFGKTKSSNLYKRGYFYHAISESIIFNTTNLRFTQPISTTKTFEIVHYFCSLNKLNNDGIIVGLRGFAINFDCSFVSLFTNQNEHLFMTGYDALNIENIINYKNCNHFRKYLYSLNIFMSLIEGRRSEFYVTDNIELILKSLIDKKGNHNSNIPQYFRLIFNECMRNTKTIKIDFNNIKNLKYGKNTEKYLLSLLLTSPNDITKSFINLDILCKLFINCQQIIIRLGYKCKMDSSYISLMASHLNNPSNKSLKKIQIEQFRLKDNDQTVINSLQVTDFKVYFDNNQIPKLHIDPIHFN